VSKRQEEIEFYVMWNNVSNLGILD